MQKVALVTGSGRRRVGNVVARVFGEAGYAVAVHYSNSEREANETITEFRAAGIACHAFRADVTREAEVDRLFAQIAEKFSRLDVLVTTASRWQAKRLEEVRADDVLDHFRVDALGTFLCCRRAGLAMAAQEEGGAIITIGDWAVSRPYVDYTPYFIAKGTIPTMTRALAVELAARNPNVRVNCIQPGPVLFPEKLSEREREELVNATLVRKADRPELLANMARALAENPFVTGACLPVDGGRTIYAP